MSTTSSSQTRLEAVIQPLIISGQRYPIGLLLTQTKKRSPHLSNYEVSTTNLAAVKPD
ncbi:MAG: hypothetical protein MGG37_17130 [Trichodesmium sp. MAG_R01]|nr:hypothetical protein [Trichodesmium sp. MAG_R01]